MMYLGTSGFSYKDWVGPVYPEGLPSREWLAFYAREFNSCEINSTYYALPAPTTLKAMAAKTGEDFRFVFKANQEMTHLRQDNQAVFTGFLQALEPVAAAGKLGCILAQFPYSFGYQRRNWDYLARLAKHLNCYPVVIEFRNAGWLKKEVLDWLKEEGLGFCCVDEPRLPNLMPPAAEATSRIGYLRFHGRNAAKWWRYEQAYERYDYSYSSAELAEWLPGIKALTAATETMFVFANNHWRGQSVATIRQLKLLLD